MQVQLGEHRPGRGEDLGGVQALGHRREVAAVGQLQRTGPVRRADQRLEPVPARYPAVQVGPGADGVGVPAQPVRAQAVVVQDRVLPEALADQRLVRRHRLGVPALPLQRVRQHGTGQHRVPVRTGGALQPAQRCLGGRPLAPPQPQRGEQCPGLLAEVALPLGREQVDQGAGVVPPPEPRVRPLDPGRSGTRLALECRREAGLGLRVRLLVAERTAGPVPRLPALGPQRLSHPERGQRLREPALRQVDPAQPEVGAGGEFGRLRMRTDPAVQAFARVLEQRAGRVPAGIGEQRLRLDDSPARPA